ncbi:MAG: response regulator [Aestuariivirga sp.]
MAGDEVVQDGARRSSGRQNAVALVLAFLLAVAVGALAYRVQGLYQLPLLAAAALLSFFGLCFAFFWLAGVIKFAGSDSERQFFDIVSDGLSDAILVTDEKGRGLFANGPYLKLVSMAGGSRLVGFDVLYSGYTDVAVPVYQLAQSANEGKAASREVRLAPGARIPGASSGQARWIRLSVAPLASNVRGGTTLWRYSDVTAERVDQEAVFVRLQHIVTYLDNAPVGFFSSQPNGKIDYVNATLAGWLGFDLTEAQSGQMTLAALVGNDAARQLTAVAPVANGHRIEKASLALKSKSGSSDIYQLVCRTDFDKNGASLPLRAMVMRGSADTASAAQDVMAQFSATAPMGVAEIDEKGVLQKANAEFLSISKAAKIGSLLSVAMKPDSRSGLQEALASLQGKSFASSKLEAMFEGEPPRNAQLTLAKLAGSEGMVTVFSLDRTESKSLEVQLAQSQKMQAVGELASGIAHDFNNVLTPIIGFADLLLAKLRPTDPSFQDVMNIKQNAARAANLVRQLLAFSRKQTLQPKVLDLSAALSDLGILLDRVLSGKAELQIIHGRDLWPVFVDIHQFEQVIINLAVNARDAMPKGGKLFVRTYNLPADKSQSTGHVLPEADYVVCQVEDTGTGIPKDILDKIWAPFFTTKEVGKGTGLGLSMVYGIVKQTGGFIYCDSEIGKGTTFSIFLPRHTAVETATPVAAVAEVVPVREDFSGRGRILIVEDEPSVRAFAIRALTARGYTVVEAESGEAGLEAVENDKDGFELILSDVVMPEMDGPTMLKELRRRKVTAKFIFMSGYAEDAFERNADGPTDYDFLQKPFSLKQLVEKVKAVLG